jgi:hypothetical protein
MLKCLENTVTNNEEIESESKSRNAQYRPIPNHVSSHLLPKKLELKIQKP